MSTIMTSTGITFPDSTTQTTVANTPYVACRATLPYATPGLQLTFDSSTPTPTFQTIPINTRDTSYPNYTSFDNSNYWFSAPNAGYYFVSGGVYINSGGYFLTNSRVAIAINGTANEIENVSLGAGGAYYQGYQFWRKTAGLFYLNSGDKVTAQLSATSTNYYCYCTSYNCYVYVNYAALEIQQIRY